MSSIFNLQDERRDEVLNEAIRRETPVVLTVRRRNAWATLKSSFLAVPPTEHRLAIAAPQPHHGPGDAALQSGEQVGVSFRRGHKKCMFATTVQCTDVPRGGGLSDAGVVVLRWPQTLQELQRRVYHRASPPPGRGITTQIWLGHLDESTPATPPGPPRFAGALEDLSVGGTRVCLATKGGFDVGEPVVCAFAVQPNARPFVLNAVFRHVEPKDGTFSHGFQFVGLEVCRDGRQVLTRLARAVTDFQRAAARRTARNRPHRI